MEFVPGETLDDHRARRRAGRVAGARLYLPDLQCGGSRPPARRAASRPEAANVSSPKRHAEGRDFGTSRFLEIAAHGTPVIGSPPYMAPERSTAKRSSRPTSIARVTMYQMMTGFLPYDTPRRRPRSVMRGELQRAAAQESEDPKGHDIVSRRWRGDSCALPARGRLMTTCSPRAALRRGGRRITPAGDPIMTTATTTYRRSTAASCARSAPAEVLRHCRKPLHARSDRCPFCGEAQ